MSESFTLKAHPRISGVALRASDVRSLYNTIPISIAPLAPHRRPVNYYLKVFFVCHVTNVFILYILCIVTVSSFSVLALNDLEQIFKVTNNNNRVE